MASNFHARKKITAMTKDDRGCGHEWSIWRLDLQDFSALLFKPRSAARPDSVPRGIPAPGS
jgi:hypothetical protein